MEFLSVLGSWKVLALGIGAVMGGAVASFVAFEQEVRTGGKRRERWGSTGARAVDVSLAGVLIALLAVVAMVARWAVT